MFNALKKSKIQKANPLFKNILPSVFLSQEAKDKMEEQKKEMQKQMQEMRDRTHGNGMCKYNTVTSIISCCAFVFLYPFDGNSYSNKSP